MGTSYVDLVLVSHTNDKERYLFQAPGFSYLKKGDRVYVNTKYGEREGKVVKAIPIIKYSDEYYFILSCCNATLPLCKVTAKLNTVPFVYAEESEEEANAE